MKIEVLYPEVCNLFGDLANADFLARSSGAEIVKTSLKEEPRFITEDIALVYMCGMTERNQTIVKNAFKPYLEALMERTEKGGVTLITGNAMELFGEYIENDDGSREEMLGVFKTHAVRRMMSRYNSLYLGELEGDKIIGFKSQFTHSYGDNGDGFIKTIRGAGLNPDTVAEGIRVNNLMMTYVLGPIVILNPPLARYLLKLMGVEEPKLCFEEMAVDVYETRLREFSEPTRGFTY